MSADVTLVVRRTIKAAPARVYDAWTQPEHLLRWWGPRPVTCAAAEMDVRAGGAYRIGNRMPDGSVLWLTGLFEVVDPPRRLVYSWAFEGEDAPPSRVTVRFEPHGDDATEVIVLHERIDTPRTRDGHETGWLGCLDGLASLFDAGP